MDAGEALAQHAVDRLAVADVGQVDVAGDNVRIVTAYRPDPNEWESDLKTRRTRK